MRARLRKRSIRGFSIEDIIVQLFRRVRDKGRAVCKLCARKK